MRPYQPSSPLTLATLSRHRRRHRVLKVNGERGFAAGGRDAVSRTPFANRLSMLVLRIAATPFNRFSIALYSLPPQSRLRYTLFTSVAQAQVSDVGRVSPQG